MNSENQNKIIPFNISDQFPIDFGMEDPENWEIVEEVKKDSPCDEMGKVTTSKVKQLHRPKQDL